VWSHDDYLRVFPTLAMKNGYFTLTSDERPALIAHYLRLSPADRYFRFGATLSIDALTGFCNKIALKFVHGFYLRGELIGVVVLAPDSPQHVEFAVSVNSEHRGRGLARLLLDFAVASADEDHMVIRHAAENHAMRKVHKGYRSTLSRAGSEVEVAIDLMQLRDEMQSAQTILCGAEA
jgi:GNAT superfamily N-acetyltransferase